MSQRSETGVDDVEFCVLDLELEASPQADRFGAAELVGNAIDRLIRADDVLLRYHNGRFVLILVGATPELAEGIATRLRLAVQALDMSGLVSGELALHVSIESRVQPEQCGDASVRSAIDAAVNQAGANDRDFAAYAARRINVTELIARGRARYGIG